MLLIIQPQPHAQILWQGRVAHVRGVRPSRPQPDARPPPAYRILAAAPLSERARPRAQPCKNPCKCRVVSFTNRLVFRIPHLRKPSARCLPALATPQPGGRKKIAHPFMGGSRHRRQSSPARDGRSVVFPQPANKPNFGPHPALPTPTGLRPLAQGCEAASYPGYRRPQIISLSSIVSV